MRSNPVLFFFPSRSVPFQCSSLLIPSRSVPFPISHSSFFQSCFFPFFPMVLVLFPFSHSLPPLYLTSFSLSSFPTSFFFRALCRHRNTTLATISRRLQTDKWTPSQSLIFVLLQADKRTYGSFFDRTDSIYEAHRPRVYLEIAQVFFGVGGGTETASQFSLPPP
jgi:hypothetical protein